MIRKLLVAIHSINCFVCDSGTYVPVLGTSRRPGRDVPHCIRNSLWNGLLAFLLSLFLTGCGFHLRGHAPLPPQLQVMYLQTSSPFSPLTKQLRQILCSNGVQLAPYAGAAPVSLQILSDTFNQSMTSVGSSQQVTTYYLTYTITYQLNDAAGHILLGPQTILTNRSYTVASNQILADTSTLLSLQEDMRQDAIFQLLNRLRAPVTVHAVSQVC